MEVLDNIPFGIDAGEVLRQAHLTGLDDEIEQAALELVDAARRVARPKALYEVCYVESRTDDTTQIGAIEFTSRVLRINLDGVERVFPYVVTCGAELDEMAGRQGDMLLGYCLEIIKERALGAAWTCLRECLQTKYALGQTSSMNPGSLDDWPITQQNELFSIFGDVEKLIGVKLTQSCLMLPNKSVSGIVFPTEVTFESCQLCPRPVCENRRAEFDPELAQAYGLSALGDSSTRA